MSDLYRRVRRAIRVANALKRAVVVGQGRQIHSERRRIVLAARRRVAAGLRPRHKRRSR